MVCLQGTGVDAGVDAGLIYFYFKCNTHKIKMNRLYGRRFQNDTRTRIEMTATLKDTIAFGFGSKVR